MQGNIESGIYFNVVISARNNFRLRQMALDACDFRLQSSNACIQRSNGLSNHLCERCGLLAIIQSYSLLANLAVTLCNFTLHLTQFGCTLPGKYRFRRSLNSFFNLTSLVASCISELRKSTFNTIIYTIKAILYSNGLVFNLATEVAATIANLLSKTHVALLDSVDNLLPGHAYLVPDIAYLRSYVVDSGLHLLYRAIQGAGELANVYTVALDSIHKHLPFYAIVVITSKQAVAISSKDSSNDDKADKSFPASVSKHTAIPVAT